MALSEVYGLERFSGFMMANMTTDGKAREMSTSIASPSRGSLVSRAW